MAFFKTHYYGGIKKYQWLTIPLAIHGVVVKGDGTPVEIVIGEGEDDPVFHITDLLPHLAREQMQKKMSEAVTGEGLNLLLGSMPFRDEKVKEKVKLNILNILNKRYGIVEEDFQSAELEIVPAQRARDVGFDKSMVGGYGRRPGLCISGTEGADGYRYPRTYRSMPAYRQGRDRQHGQYGSAVQSPSELPCQYHRAVR